MEASTPVCLVCGIPLPLSSKRRTLSPPLDVNREARGFPFAFICNRDFDCDSGSSPSYACKSCFAKLEKGSRQYSNIISLISDLRTTVREAGSIAVAMCEPFSSPSTVAPVSSGTQTELPQTALKRFWECEDTEPVPRRLRLTEQKQLETGVAAVTVNVPKSASVPQKRSLESWDTESTPKRCRLFPKEDDELPPEPSTPASVLKVSHNIWAT